MTRTRLFWRIYPPFFLLSLAALAAMTWFGFRTLQDFQLRQTETEIQDRARLLSASTARLLRDGTVAELQAICRAEGRDGNVRVTFLAPDGRVLADSQEEPAGMDNHADRPEIRNALRHGSGISRRWSHTLGRDLIYATAAVRDGDQVVALIRAAMPLADFQAHLGGLYRNLAATALIVLALVAAGTYVLTRRITRPLRDMQAAAARFAAGDFSAKLRLAHSREMDALAQDLNRMAAQLDERFRTIARQRNEEQAILGSMTEGLLAVDCSQHILTLNNAAARVLGTDPQQAVGRSFIEIARTPSLHEILTRALESDTPVEGEAELAPQQELCLRVHGSPLTDAAGKRIGAVLVWTDMPRQRRLADPRSGSAVAAR
jgi:two-component system phosphate regulon sensor histidine kinase PhoR